MSYDFKTRISEDLRRTNILNDFLDHEFYGKHNFDFDRYGYKDLSGEYDCKKNYYELDLERGVYPEFLIAVTSRDGILKVSGQIDCLIKNGNEITILD